MSIIFVLYILPPKSLKLDIVLILFCLLASKKEGDENRLYNSFKKAWLIKV